jgi:hypothetical protein
MATSASSMPATVPGSPAVRSAGALLDGDTWTGTDAFARAGVPTITLQQPPRDSVAHVPLGHASNPQWAEFHSATETLVGYEAEAGAGPLGSPGRRRRSPPPRVDPLSDFAHFQGNDLLVLRDYKLSVQGQRDKRSMQGSVLLGIISVIILTLVLVVVGVGIKWITEGFGEHIISLVLTAALSGLGGAVAWAFRGASTASSRHPPDAGLPPDR